MGAVFLALCFLERGRREIKKELVGGRESFDGYGCWLPAEYVFIFVDGSSVFYQSASKGRKKKEMRRYSGGTCTPVFSGGGRAYVL